MIAAAQPCPTFTCMSCNRDMVVLVGDAPTEPCCHRCRMLPGWQKKPEVAALCDLNDQLLAPVAADSAEVGSAPC